MSAAEMLRIAAGANILKIMGERRSATCTLDIIPPRGEVIVPRINEADDSLTAPAPTIATLRFHLEEHMFGGVVFAAVSCQGHVIVNPFPWKGWDNLAVSRIA